MNTPTTFFGPPAASMVSPGRPEVLCQMDAHHDLVVGVRGERPARGDLHPEGLQVLGADADLDHQRVVAVQPLGVEQHTDRALHTRQALHTLELGFGERALEDVVDALLGHGQVRRTHFEHTPQRTCGCCRLRSRGPPR
ncbi:MAG: hypothetical protein M5U19_06525 [Microthrixaceae bacterium]|nr:hypothetical protein [Microthrixaceae bacterium]